MRILLISDFYPPTPGGLEFHVDALAAELAARGDEVCVATLTRSPVPPRDGVVIRTIPSLARLLPHESADRPFHPPIAEPVARRALRRIAAEFRPDVVHGHSWLTASLPGDLDVPVVYTAHDYGLVCQLRTMLRPDDSICSGPQPAKCRSCGVDRYGAAKSTLLTHGTIAGRRRFPADHVVAVSTAVQRALSPSLSIPIEVIPNFVAAEPPHESLPADVPAGRFAFYAGDAGDHKGVPDLLALWESDPPAMPLVLATTRPLERAVPANIVPVTLRRGQVAAAFSRATVALAPSRWADPCPTVVLEAMRAGVPVVGTRVGGIPDLVRDNVDGLLVAPGEPAAIGRAVAAIERDPDLAARLGASGRERAADFDVVRVVDRIRGCYQHLRAGPRLQASL
jgi:glycosyltransferase involved in cell wall biosynthesis